MVTAFLHILRMDTTRMRTSCRRSTTNRRSSAARLTRRVTTTVTKTAGAHLPSGPHSLLTCHHVHQLCLVGNRLSTATERTGDRYHSRPRRQKRKQRHMMPISRASSISSITDSTMSLNIVTVTLNLGNILVLFRTSNAVIFSLQCTD